VFSNKIALIKKSVLSKIEPHKSKNNEKNKLKAREVIYEVCNCCMIEFCKENQNQKERKVTYEVLNGRNLQTKQIKKTLKSKLAHFHLTKYDVINAYWTYAVFGTFCRNKR